MHGPVANLIKDSTITAYNSTVVLTKIACFASRIAIYNHELFIRLALRSMGHRACLKLLNKAYYISGKIKQCCLRFLLQFCNDEKDKFILMKLVARFLIQVVQLSSGRRGRHCRTDSCHNLGCHDDKPNDIKFNDRLLHWTLFHQLPYIKNA